MRADDEHLNCGCPWGYPCGVVGESNCTLCGKWLGRQTGKGAHYNCRQHLKFTTKTLASNLAIGAGLCAAFDLGLYNTECGNVHPSVNWWPGCKRSVP